MKYRLGEDQHAVVLTPTDAPATASVIWLHGLGADGHDFVPIVPELRLPAAVHARFIFPHAPVRTVSINQGARMRAWYDIKALSLGALEDADGIRASAAIVHKYLRLEREAGIAANRIVIAGFSQGGAMALHSGLRSAEPLAGILALSAYLPLRERVAAEASEANRAAPIMMCHGRQDPVVTIQLGEMSRDALLQQQYLVLWHDYPMQHEVCAAEIHDISVWLSERLG
jgi:phospholipase/carboxylesterase